MSNPIQYVHNQCVWLPSTSLPLRCRLPDARPQAARDASRCLLLAGDTATNTMSRMAEYRAIASRTTLAPCRLREPSKSVPVQTKKRGHAAPPPCHAKRNVPTREAANRPCHMPSGTCAAPANLEKEKRTGNTNSKRAPDGAATMSRGVLNPEECCRHCWRGCSQPVASYQTTCV